MELPSFKIYAMDHRAMQMREKLGTRKLRPFDAYAESQGAKLADLSIYNLSLDEDEERELDALKAARAHLISIRTQDIDRENKAAKKRNYLFNNAWYPQSKKERLEEISDDTLKRLIKVRRSGDVLLTGDDNLEDLLAHVNKWRTDTALHERNPALANLGDYQVRHISESEICQQGVSDKKKDLVAAYINTNRVEQLRLRDEKFFTPEREAQIKEIEGYTYGTRKEALSSYLFGKRRQDEFRVDVVYDPTFREVDEIGSKKGVKLLKRYGEWCDAPISSAETYKADQTFDEAEFQRLKGEYLKFKGEDSSPGLSEEQLRWVVKAKGAQFLTANPTLYAFLKTQEKSGYMPRDFESVAKAVKAYDNAPPLVKKFRETSYTTHKFNVEYTWGPGVPLGTFTKSYTLGHRNYARVPEPKKAKQHDEAYKAMAERVKSFTGEKLGQPEHDTTKENETYWKKRLDKSSGFERGERIEQEAAKLRWGNRIKRSSFDEIN